ENVLSQRTYHVAVWTGQKMLVWGGRPLDSNLGLYCAASCTAVPSDVGVLSAAKSVTTATFSWAAIPAANRYDVLRGTLEFWPVGSAAASETCLADGVSETTA